jgi:subtilase family serine protease
MNPTRTLARTVLACLAVTAITLTAAAAAAAVPVPSAGTMGGPARAGLAMSGLALQPGPGIVPPGHVYPLWRLAGARRLVRRPGAAAAPLAAPGGYGAGNLRAYLGLRGSGAGQTVAVTEAFNVQNPLSVATFGKQDDVTNALARYDSWYGLSPACSARVTTGCFRLRFTAPHGTAPPSLANGTWTIEAELDVEMIHALAPRASIVVVEGHDNGVKPMMAAVGYAQSLHPAAISNSWTVDEFAGEKAIATHCTATGAPCVFSAGDCGSYRNSSCPAGMIGGFPAANAGVLAVGGTALSLSPTGKVRSETAWSDSGGGVSRYEPVPRYQRAADPRHGGRGIPDVSFDADPSSGVATYFYIAGTVQGQLEFLINGWSETGGTSVGAPAWAAILASAAQLRAAAGKPLLTIAGLHAALYGKSGAKPIADITVGVNGLCRPACAAGPGYDLVTGEGSPRRGIDSYLARQ